MGQLVRRQRLGSATLWACLLLGCQDAMSVEPVCTGPTCHEPSNVPPPRSAVCDRDGDDLVRDVFCGSGDVTIRSLSELLAQLSLHPTPRPYVPQPGPNDPLGAIRETVFIVSLAHSTALSGRLVSPINPRSLLLDYDSILAFQRGVQRVEIVTRARDMPGFSFYLVEFTQACNERKQGCSPGDLYTPRIESDWLRVELRDDEALKNTALDCRQCHQRGLDRPIVLMREVESPWTHFFETPTPQAQAQLPGVRGSHLVQDYLAAKGDEPYGGVATAEMTRTSAIVLQGIAGMQQPLLFDSPRIQAERWGEGPDVYANQPGPSATWENAYAAFKRGEQLAPPYVEPRATDLEKQARLTEAYTRYRSGELSADQLPDLGDIFPDDPRLRARIGLQTEPGSGAADALIQACGACHNDVLDQGISRARFNIDVSRLDRAALDLAIARIQLPRTAAGAMPPPEARQLDPVSQANLIEYLRQRAGTQVDPALARAAALGMTGGRAR